MHTSNGTKSITDSYNGFAEPDSTSKQQLNVAIVGGGIVGCVTALGLLKRGITVKLYEQAGSFREIGAGLAFTTNAQTCMERTDPNILAAMKAVSTKNQLSYYTYVDGYHAQSNDANDMSEKELFRLHAGKTGFDGCHRAHFLDELVKYIPDGVVEFQKRLSSYVVGENPDEPLILHFEDDTVVTADAIIGCDGIRSRVRSLLLGPSSPASTPHFTHQIAYRGLIPMSLAVSHLGAEKAHNQCMHMGPSAHVLNFPIAQHTLINVVAFAPHPKPWPSSSKLTAPATKDEVMHVFRDWNPAVRTIVSLLNDELDQWAIFDTYDHPAPSFSRGPVCLAGDAAHASSPHHGAGAGFGIEDALALSTVMEGVVESLSEGKGVRKRDALSAAFEAYDEIRRGRCEWLVRSSREVGGIYEWGGKKEVGDGYGYGGWGSDIERRAWRIWDFDIEGMVGGVREAYGRRLGGV